MKCKVRCLKLEFRVKIHNNFSFKEKWQLDEDKLTFIILAPISACKSLTSDPPTPHLDELFRTNSGLSPTDKCLADGFQMIGDVNIFLNGAIPPSQPPSKSSPQVHITTTSNVSSLHLSARELQNQNFIEEVKDSEEDGDGDDGNGDFQAEVEIMIAGTYFYYYFCSYDLDMIYFILFFIYLL